VLALASVLYRERPAEYSVWSLKARVIKQYTAVDVTDNELHVSENIFFVAMESWVHLLAQAGWAFHYELVKMLPVCVRARVCVWWLLTSVEQIETAAQRDL